LKECAKWGFGFEAVGESIHKFWINKRYQSNEAAKIL